MEGATLSSEPCSPALASLEGPRGAGVLGTGKGRLSPGRVESSRGAAGAEGFTCYHGELLYLALNLFQRSFEEAQ